MQSLDVAEVALRARVRAIAAHPGDLAPLRRDLEAAVHITEDAERLLPLRHGPSRRSRDACDPRGRWLSVGLVTPVTNQRPNHDERHETSQGRRRTIS